MNDPKNQLIRNFKLSLLLMTLVSCSSLPNKTKVHCSLPEPIILKNEGAVLFQYWDLNQPDLSALHSTNFTFPRGLQSYSSTLKKKYDLAPITLLKASDKNAGSGDKANSQVVIGAPDSIRKVNCLEAKLMNIQNSRVDLLKEPTEFIAFLLSKNSKRKLYYFTSNIAGVRSLGYIHTQLDHLLKSGWQLEYNLHNHNFFINEKENYLGGIAPSVTDSWLYQMEFKDYKLKKAIVTNGFNSAEIDSTLFSKLATKNEEK